MPCTSDGYPTQAEMLRDEVNDLTALLCETCEQMENFNMLHQLPKNTREWWDHHKALDKARKDKEAATARRLKLRTETINKLTKEELDALGVKLG